MNIDQAVAQVKPMAYSLARQVGGQPGTPDYDDLIQAGFVKLVRDFPRFKPERMSWSSYAYMSMRSGMLREREKQLRRNAQSVQLQEDADDQDGAYDRHAPEDVDFSQADLSKLPRLYRRALKIGNVRGLVRTGLPEPEARRLLQCSMFKLRQLIARPL